MTPPQFPYPYPAPAPPRRRVGTIVGFLLCGLVIAVLLATTVALTVAWGNARDRADGAQSELTTAQQKERDATSARDNETKVREIAAKYAAGASTFDYRDLGPWKKALTDGVTPELKTKMDSTSGAMEQLLTPLQWVSKGIVDGTVLKEHSGSTYKVTAYVLVTTNNAQNPTTTLTSYSVTVDQARNWLISEVTGALPNV